MTQESRKQPNIKEILDRCVHEVSIGNLRRAAISDNLSKKESLEDKMGIDIRYIDRILYDKRSDLLVVGPTTSDFEDILNEPSRKNYENDRLTIINYVCIGPSDFAGRSRRAMYNIGVPERDFEDLGNWILQDPNRMADCFEKQFGKIKKQKRIELFRRGGLHVIYLSIRDDIPKISYEEDINYEVREPKPIQP